MIGKMWLKILKTRLFKGFVQRTILTGMIFVRPAKSPSADLFCDFRNPDGSRSFAVTEQELHTPTLGERGGVGDEAVLEACDGLHKVRWNKEYSLPSVQFASLDTPSNSDGDWFVNTGSPHHIIIVSDTQVLESFDIEKIGAEIRYSQKYESIGGTNVSGLARTPDPSTIHLRTYERGVEAETRACGTGAVAAALIDHTDKGGETSRKVVMPGGDLHVEFEEGVGGQECLAFRKSIRNEKRCSNPLPSDMRLFISSTSFDSVVRQPQRRSNNKRINSKPWRRYLFIVWSYSHKNIRPAKPPGCRLGVQLRYIFIL